MRALLFPVGPDWYAVEMSSVREVVSDPRPTELPTAPAVFLGLFNLRGEIVPLFDTASLLDMGSVGPATSCVVVLTPLGPAGLAATGIPEVVELGDPIGAAEGAATVATFAVGRRLAALLDAPALLAPARTAGRGAGP